MTTYPNCKINIGLRVVRKREDGYHDLETIFYPVHGLHDTLEVDIVPDTDSKDITFTQSGILVNCPEEQNLIVKAYRMMRQAYPQIQNVYVHLHKHIPFGAGLGGGSSDAAHMAMMLNEMFHLDLSREALASMLKPMGADCPFFVYNTPCFATGIGEELQPIALSLKGKRILMIKPDTFVSTREAYAGVQKKGPFPHWEEALLQGPTSHTKVAEEAFHNDFEDTIFSIHPELQHIKQRLIEQGALYAAMSGSGSTIYGLFEDDTEGGTHTRFGTLDKDFASMIILNDTLG